VIPAAVLAVLVLAATAFVLGRTVTGDLDLPGERWAIPMACGLALLAHLGLLLGFAGLLRPGPVLVLVAVIHLLGIRAWRGRNLRVPWLGAATLLPGALLALYPPTAFDATLYHLPFARAFAASGGIPFLPDLRFPVFPQANEMLFALVLLFAPDLAAQGAQWLMAALTASLVWAWGRDAFGGEAGRLAAAAWLGAPIVVYLAGSAYVDAGLTLFVTAALYALRRWRGSGERRWLLLAALFAATAADVKYLGLFFLGVTGLAVLLGRLPEPRSRWRDVLLFAAVALAALAPWYGRIYAWTGNPLFPYFPRIFGDSPWAPLNFHGFGGGSLGSHLVRLARLPWDTVFERGRYGFQPPHSPVWLVALPLALLAALRDPRQRRLLALAAVYAFACLSLPPDSRYLVPITPLIALSATGIAARFTDRRLLAAGLCAACLLPGALYALYRLRLQGPPPLTPAARETWLARRLPLYPAVAFLNREGGSTAWALHAENMHYYARGRLLGDWYGPASFARVLGGLANPEDLHERLRRLGAGHLLIAAGQNPGLPFPEDAGFRRWFEPVYADPAARVYRLR
jgi:hypothetical protein